MRQHPTLALTWVLRGLISVAVIATIVGLGLNRQVISLSNARLAYNAEEALPTAGNGLQPCDVNNPSILYYAIASSASSYTNSIWQADQFWVAEGINQAVRLINNNTEALYTCNTSIYLDAVNAGNSGWIAETVNGDSYNACPSQTQLISCVIHFNTYGGYSAYNQVNTFAHEMGHWLGLGHSDIDHACDSSYPAMGCGNNPATFAGPAVMQTTESPTVTTATCDDIQSFLSARWSYYHNTLANPSFEYSANCWGLLGGSTGQANWA